MVMYHSSPYTLRDYTLENYSTSIVPLHVNELLLFNFSSTVDLYQHEDHSRALIQASPMPGPRRTSSDVFSSALQANKPTAKV